MASVVMTDDPEHLSPLWNPLRLAREAGRQASYDGTFGHFVCVDEFGQPSAQERTAGLPMHGEAHTLRFMVQREPKNAVTLFRDTSHRAGGFFAHLHDGERRECDLRGQHGGESAGVRPACCLGRARDSRRTISCPGQGENFSIGLAVSES